MLKLIFTMLFLIFFFRLQSGSSNFKCRLPRIESFKKKSFNSNEITKQLCEKKYFQTKLRMKREKDETIKLGPLVKTKPEDLDKQRKTLNQSATKTNEHQSILKESNISTKFWYRKYEM